MWCGGWCFCSLGMLTTEPTAHPGTAPARGTRPQEEAAAGDQEEGGEVGDLLGEALRPARPPLCPPGLLGTPRRRDALLRHRGCRCLAWKPGKTSTLKAAELLSVGAWLNLSSWLKRYPGSSPIARGGGWRAGLSWDGCGRKLEHLKREGEEREELKKGGEVLDFCDALGPASPAAFLGTVVAFWGRKRMHRTMAWRAVLEMGSLHIHKAVRVARLPRGTHVPRALLGQGDQLGTRGGWGNLGASLGAQGSPGSTGAHQ